MKKLSVILKAYLKNLFNPRLGEVWMLHRVTMERQDAGAACNGTPCAGWTITPKQLEALIVSNIRLGRRFISIRDVLEGLHRPLPLRTLMRMNRRWICITLDDGYYDNYSEAVPIFRKYSIPFCIYVSDGFLGQKFAPRTDAPLMMSEDQISELSVDPLCTIGSHTVNHPDMSLLSYGEQLEELKSSKRNIEKLCNIPVETCAIPGGANPFKCKLAREAGFKSQMNGWGGSVRFRSNPFDIPRIIPKTIGDV